MANMLVSVIIPCYNSEKFIKQCLESVLYQTYKNLEIILINDGSIDKTETIIKNTADNRIKYFYKPNGGLSSARNYGIQKSTGNYISFLDSDDYWQPDKIEKQMAKIKNADVVYTNYKTVNNAGVGVKKKKIIKPVLNQNELKKTLLIKNVILGSGSSVLIKKEVVFKTGLFNTNLKIGEDWDYWSRMAWLNFTFCFIDETLVTIRYNDTSMQQTTFPKEWKTSTETILKTFLTYKNLSAKNRASVYKKLLINSYFFGNSFKEIFQHYCKAIKNNIFFAFHFDTLFLMLKYYPRNVKRTFKSYNNV